MRIKLSPRMQGSRRLPFPAARKIRAAQITSGKFFDGVEAFAPDRWRDLEQFQPQILVGPGPELQSLAELMGKRSLQFPSLDHAVFLVTRYGEAPATDVQRVVLWQSFAVPVYELFLGPRNVLLAQECEAHDGWHVQKGASFSLHQGELVVNGPDFKLLGTGLTGDVENSPCACKRAGQRVLNIREHYGPVPYQRRLAATA